MLSSTPQGFAYARWVQGFCYGTVASSLLVALLNIQPRFLLKWHPHLAEWGQWSRIFLNPLVWTNQGSAMIGALLAYECRGVERQIGSRRMGVFLLETGLLSMIIVPSILGALGLLGINIAVQPGPQALVAALVSLYHSLVPNVYYMRMSGAGIWSDKSFIYLLLLVNCTSLGGFLKTATGWILAKLIYADVIPGRKWAF